MGRVRPLVITALALSACHAVLPLSGPGPAGDAVPDRTTPTDAPADRLGGPAPDAPGDATPLDVPQVADAPRPPGEGPSADVHSTDADLKLLCAVSTSWGCISTTNQCQLRCPPQLGASPQLLLQCTTSGKCDCTTGGLTTTCSGTFPFVKLAPCSACDAARAAGCCAP